MDREDILSARSAAARALLWRATAEEIMDESDESTADDALALARAAAATLDFAEAQGALVATTTAVSGHATIGADFVRALFEQLEQLSAPSALTPTGHARAVLVLSAALT